MHRRNFLQSISALALIGSERARSETVRYVGRSDCIDVVRLGKRTQSAPSLRPVFLTFSRDRKLLFAVNFIDNFKGLPAGSVESFYIQPQSGQLTLIGRRSLSLSSTFPRHCAVSPDGRHLVVAAYGGGTYNVLPINASGELGPVMQVIKEIGCGPDLGRQASAHPHSVAFDASGRFLVGTDLGSDRINVFRYEDGHMVCVQRKSTASGSGPATIIVNPAQPIFTILHELKPLVARYQLDPQSGLIREILYG